MSNYGPLTDGDALIADHCANGNLPGESCTEMLYGIPIRVITNTDIYPYEKAGASGLSPVRITPLGEFRSGEWTPFTE